MAAQAPSAGSHDSTDASARGAVPSRNDVPPPTITRPFERTTPKASVRAWRMRGPSVQASDAGSQIRLVESERPSAAFAPPATRTRPSSSVSSTNPSRSSSRGAPTDQPSGAVNSIGVGGSPMLAPPPAHRSSDPSANARPSWSAVTCGQTMPSWRPSINGPTSCQRAGAGGVAGAADAAAAIVGEIGIVRGAHGVGVGRRGLGRSCGVATDVPPQATTRPVTRTAARNAPTTPPTDAAAAGRGRDSGDLPPRSRGSGIVHVLIVDRVRLARVPGLHAQRRRPSAWSMASWSNSRNKRRA